MSEDERVSTIPGQCPTPIELGNSGWNVLHSAAAVYPYKPSKVQREAMASFIESWSHVYACDWCAYHMRTYLREHPPDVKNKLSVSRYLCELHNAVNENLGKDQYDCDPMKVLQRWHPGYPDRMEDKPTMEERIAAEQRKDAEAALQRQREREAMESRLSNFGGRPTHKDPESWRATATTSGGHTSGDLRTGWSTAHTEEPQGGPLSSEAAPVGAAPVEAERRQRRWWLFGGRAFQSSSSGEPASTTATASSAGRGVGETDTQGLTTVVRRGQDGFLPTASPKAPDSTTDVAEVLRRLRGCQVYCPEDETLAKK